MNPLRQLKLREKLSDLSLEQLEALRWQLRWKKLSRPNQRIPEGDDWEAWGIIAGRGFGKTRTGAEAVGWIGAKQKDWRIGVIAPTIADVRDTCFEGVSGLMNVIPSCFVAEYNKSLLQLTLKSGTQFKGFSSETPERLRGPQFNMVWGDEVAAWIYLRQTLDMMYFGLRLGETPRFIFTTTPKPLPEIRELVNNPRTVITRGSTYENRANLAAKFFEKIASYEGTRIGRQEIHAEILDEEEGGIFTRSWLRLWPNSKPIPKLLYVIQSYDTAFTDDSSNHPTACTTWGVFYNEQTKRNAVLLLDCWSDWLNYPDLRKKAAKEYNTWYGPEEGARKPDIVLVEVKATGMPLMQDLQRAGVPARGYNPGRADKIQRAHSVSHIPSNGLVFLPESGNNAGKPRNWAEPFVDQLCTFSPETLESVEKTKVGAERRHHFDYVDTFTQAMAVLRDMKMLSIDPEVIEERIREIERVNPYAA